MLPLFYVLRFWPGGTWDLPHQGIEPVSHTLARGFSGTGPPGKHCLSCLERAFFTSPLCPSVVWSFWRTVFQLYQDHEKGTKLVLCFSPTLPVFHYNLRDDFETYVSLCMDVTAGLYHFVPPWEWDYKESWAPKNWCFWTLVLEKTLESPLDCKQI